MATKRNVGLGRHMVRWEYEPCVEKGEMEKESMILMTACNDEQFTCEYENN